MLTLIENARIHAPDDLGTGHVVTGGGQVLYLGSERPDIDHRLLSERIDLEGRALVPGLVDAHVHATGGGGEDGFSTQAMPVPLTQYTRYGVTSVVGLLGTDDETRSTAGLLARVRALREEGLSAWAWTGGYHLPATTLTGSVRRDIVSIDCIIGCGETAISDHRSSQPTFDELARLAADVHVAGLIARKAGVLHLHLGDGDRGLSLVRRLLEETELPARVFHPTHVNRKPALFEEAIELSRQGVCVDVTAFPVYEGEKAIWVADAWEQYHAAGAPTTNFTVSSDGGGCLPAFDEQGQMTHMEFGTSAGMADGIADLAGRGHALADILPAFTRNPARLLRLYGKGELRAGADADLLCLDEHHRPLHLMANGQWMVRDGEPVVTGTFEE